MSPCELASGRGRDEFVAKFSMPEQLQCEDANLRKSICLFLGCTLLVLSMRAARADEFYQHAVMSCARTTIWAEVTTHATYNDDPAPTGVTQCVLPDFGPVKLKVGAGPTYPYGAGYGVPTMFISLWVKQAKVLSREKFKCEWEGKCELRVVVTRGGLRVCRRKQAPPNASEPRNDASEDCKLTMWNDLPHERDPMEYPVRGERRRPADHSLATIFAADRKLCAALAPLVVGGSTSSTTATSEIEVIRSGYEATTTRSWEYAGFYSYYDLDANNDGHIDHVVHLHAQTHAQDRDSLFLFSRAPVPDVTIGRLEETHSSDEYSRAADLVFPRTSTDDHSAVPPPWWDPNDRLRSDRFASAYFQPIRLQGITYFLTTTSQADMRHWTTVLEPKADGSFVTTCAFQTVQPNF